LLGTQKGAQRREQKEEGDEDAQSGKAAEDQDEQGWEMIEFRRISTIACRRL
jgi:hypothetical protein